MKKERIFQIKNFSLLFLTAMCVIVCRLTNQHLPAAQSDLVSKSLYIRNMTGYLRDNAVAVSCSIGFLSIALTSFLLGYIIYQRFDRNRNASMLSIQIGMFFLLSSVYFITNSRSMFVFPIYRENIGYIAGASLMLMPHIFANYARKIYEKKTIDVMEWVLTVPSVAFFTLGMLPVPQYLYDIIVIVELLLFFTLMIFSAAVHIRNIAVKIISRKVLFLTLCSIQLALFAASVVLFLMKSMDWFFICYGVALFIMAYLSLSELLNQTSRQYIKSSDAENYRKMAYIDGLCNISNRNAFLLEQEGTYNCDVLVYVVFDVNNLKKINDRYGHVFGDRAITAVAEAVKESIGQDNAIGIRYGGDEFLLIAANASRKYAEDIKRHINSHIEKENSSGLNPVRFSVSIGYVLTDPKSDKTVTDYVNEADKLMYEIKNEYHRKNDTADQ